MIVNVITLALAFAALAVSVVVARRQALLARNDTSVAAMLQLFEEYRQDDLKKARVAVFRLDDDAIKDHRFGDLKREERIACERVSHFFDHVGLRWPSTSSRFSRWWRSSGLVAIVCG